MVNYGLSDLVAIITGANNPQGIGAATALAFAQEGAKVVLVYKKIFRQFDEAKIHQNGADRYFAANAGNAEMVENRLKEMNADYLIIESDITCEAAVKDIYAAVLAKYGRVDILVNNAADGDMDGIDTIETITQQVIDDTFAVNVRGSLLMTREFVNHRSDYGRIIYLSTDAAQIFAGQITYGASKATLEALTRSIALEVAKYGITVNAVAPRPYPDRMDRHGSGNCRSSPDSHGPIDPAGGHRPDDSLPFQPAGRYADGSGHQGIRRSRAVNPDLRSNKLPHPNDISPLKK